MHSRAVQAEIADRRAKLIRLRRAGVPYDDPRILNLGYGGPSSASKDFVRALEERRDDQAAEASVYRQEQNERLEALLEAHWGAATSGEDHKAAELVLKLLDRGAKLNGLDAPVRAEVSGPDGAGVPIGPVGLTELRNLIQTAGDPDDEDPDDDSDVA